MTNTYTTDATMADFPFNDDDTTLNSCVERTLRRPTIGYETISSSLCFMGKLLIVCIVPFFRDILFHDKCYFTCSNTQQRTKDRMKMRLVFLQPRITVTAIQ